MITSEEKSALLRLARNAIAAPLGAPAAAGTVPSSLRGRKLGAFVTVYKHGELRGCVGQVEPVEELTKLVPRLAAEAAFDDPRFLPLAADEFPHVHLDISLLSVPKRIASPDEIRPGLHGVRLKKGFRVGVFLPSVWEELKDRDLFLNALCGQKAGLEEGAWKEPGVELETFTVEVLAEEAGS